MKKLLPLIFLFTFSKSYGQYYDTSYFSAYSGGWPCGSGVWIGNFNNDQYGNVYQVTYQQVCRLCYPYFYLSKKGLPQSWSYQFGNSAYPNNMVMYGDDAGNTFVFGRLGSSININGINIPIYTDVNHYALIKFDTVGVPVWAFVTNGTHIDVSKTGYSYILNNDSLWQYSPDGLLVWARPTGGNAVHLTNNSGYYIISNGQVIQYKINGTIKWQLNTSLQFKLGKANRFYLFDSSIIEERNASNGNLISSHSNQAFTSSLLFFDSDGNYYKASDNILFKYDTQNEIWRTQLTGTTFNYLGIDKKNNIHFAGNYNYAPGILFIPPSLYSNPDPLAGMSCSPSATYIGRINQALPFTPQITTGTVKALCKEAVTNIPFTFNKYHVSYTNGLKAELSDANGNFTNPVYIGSGILSPIEAIIPFFNLTGGNYRVRVSANIPLVTGSESSPILQTAYPPAVGLLLSNENSYYPSSCAPLVMSINPPGNYLCYWYKQAYQSYGYSPLNNNNNDSLTVYGAFEDDYYVKVTDTITNCFSTLSKNNLVISSTSFSYNFDFFLPDTVCSNSAPFELFDNFLNSEFSGDAVYNNKFYPDSAGTGLHAVNLHINNAPPCLASPDTAKYIYVDTCVKEIQTLNILPAKESYCVGDTILVNFLYNPSLFDTNNTFIVQFGYYDFYYNEYFSPIAEIGNGITSPITCVIPEIYNGTNYRIRVVSTSPSFDGAFNYEGKLKIGYAYDGFQLTIDGENANCGDENSIIELIPSAGWNSTYIWHQDSLVFTDTVNSNVNSSFLATQSGNYFVEIINDYGCKSYSDTVQIDNSLAVPQFSVAASKQYICPGDSFLITLNTNATNMVEWFNYNGIFTPPDPFIFYGDYYSNNFNVTVTAPSGCYINRNVYASQRYPTGVSITAANNLQSFCEGNSLELYAQNNNNAYQYQWYKNDIAVGGEMSYEYNIQDSGIYKVKMINEYGCVSFSDTLKTTFFERPSFDILTDSVRPCLGQTYSEIAVNLSGIFPIYIKVWKDGEFVSSHDIYSPDDTISFTHDEGEGWYLLYADNTNCSPGDSDSVYVSFRSLPPAMISPVGSFTICNKDSLMLSANIGTGLTYQWRKDGGNIYNETSSTYQAKQAGTYTCVVTDNYCSASSNNVTIAVNPIPAANIFLGGGSAATFCEGNYAVLFTSSSGNRAYQWKKNDIDIPGATQSTYFVYEAGSYKIKVTNTITGCSRTSASIVITVYPLPDIIITPQGPTIFCSGGSVLLSANGAAGAIYQWSNNGINIMGATSSSYTATQSGSYVCLIAETYCNAYSMAVSVTANPLPNASITASGPTTFCTGDSVILNAIVAANRSYQWKNNGVNIPGATASFYTTFIPGKYKVTVTNTITGCSKTTVAAITITIPCRETENENSSLQFEDEKEFDVLVHPNPSSGDFVFEINNTTDENVIVEIFDMIGKMILSETINNSTFIIQHSSLSPGIYMAVISVGENPEVSGQVKKSLKIIKTE